MALSTKERDILDNSDPDSQKVALGTELYTTQANVATVTADLDTAEAAIVVVEAIAADVIVGKGITLPTSDPGVAGELWANNLVVTVSAG